MRKWLLCIPAIIMLLACSRDAGIKLIPKRDLVPILVDLHIADAIALNHAINENFGRLDSSLLYGSILESHGYTKEQLSYTLEYYAGEYDKMTGIFDEVFSELSKQSEEVKKEYQALSTAQTKLIWKPKQHIIKIKGDTVHYPEPFEADIDTTGTFLLSVEIKIIPQDKSVNPRLEAYFYNPDEDIEKNRIYFDELPIMKTYYTREYTLIKEMKDQSLSSLRITIPLQDNTDSLFSKGIEIQNLRVALLPSDSKAGRN